MAKYRKAIFAVVYAREKEKIFYLLLKRKLHWEGWEFPKGKIETGEKMTQTVQREIKEETGLKIKRGSIKDHKISGKYLYKKKLKDRPGIIGQTYHLFSCEVEKGKVKLDKLEHSNYRWVEFSKAIKLLTHSNQRKCLRVVEKSLME